MKNREMHALESTASMLVDAALAIWSSKPALRGAVDVYVPCIDDCVASILELLEGVFGELSSLQASDDEPYHFFGFEPASLEAELPLFLERLKEFLDGKKPDNSVELPYTMMAMRSSTFRCCLYEAKRGGPDE